MADEQRVAALRERFGIPGVLEFGGGQGGLVRAGVRTPQAEATVYLHGAHVTHYQPAGDAPMLFASASSRFQAGHPIRGGVPIVFPWFGPCRDDASAPMHGFARIAEWCLTAAQQEAEGSVVLTLGVDDTLATHAVWPHAYAASYTIRIGKALDLTLDIANRSDRPVVYEEALHTYLAVRDIGAVAIRGLAGLAYIDKTDAMRRKVQESDPLRIAGETDRVYLGARDTCIVEDAAAGRRLIVKQRGAEATVVWNPWIAKAKAMPDFGDDEWRRMLCIETANAADHAVRLPAGARHILQATLRSEPL
jgi:glucose-6-phosphate 1-epimerase